MEQNFQTSFIPKKPMIEERVVPVKTVSFLLIFSIFILFTILIASGGLYFYKIVVKKNLDQMDISLKTAKGRFESETITKLQTLDKRLQSSTEILSKHIAISPIFKALGEMTMKTIRFTKFDYTFGSDKDNKVLVKMGGIAVGYRDIALQADIFTQNDVYNKYMIDPVFSNLSLDNSGNVLFDLEFVVDPTFVGYKDMLKRVESESVNSIPPVQNISN